MSTSKSGAGGLRWLILFACVFLSGFYSLANAAPAAPRFVFISHAPDSDKWWNIIKNGLKHASEDFGVEVEYKNPATGDLKDMAKLIDESPVLMRLKELEALEKVTEKIDKLTVFGGLDGVLKQLVTLK